MKQIPIDAQEHPIEAITLYRYRAEVRRAITLELQAGQNDFTITNLPSSLVRDTLHVTGLSAGQASVVHTTCVPPPSLFGPNADILRVRKTKKLTELEAKRRELLRELSLINARSDVLLEYAKSLNGENTQPGEFVEFLTLFNGVGQQTLDATTKIEAEIQDINSRIGKINSDADEYSDDEKEEIQTLKRRTKVGVSISAKEACSVKLVLTYVVIGAGWNPTYELHATTDSVTHAVANTVTLHYRASISQDTGESWNDVRLTLSTAVTGGFTPQLRRGVIRDAPPSNQQNSGARLWSQGNTNSASLFGQTSAVGATSSFGSTSVATGFGAFAPSTGGAFSSANDFADQEPAVFVESNPELQILEHVGTEAKDQALASTYSVEANVSIPSGGDPPQVTVMTMQLAAKAEYVATPKLGRAVYLLCKIKNTSAHHLPAGSLVTYLDNSFVDTTGIPAVPVKGTIVKSLGEDAAIVTTFRHTTQKANFEHVPFTQKSVTTITDLITIKNARAFTIPRVLVRHAIPTPADQRFRVTLKDPEDLSQLALKDELKLRDRVKGRWIDDPNSSEITGLVEWTVDDLTPDSSEEIKMVYEVAAPEDVKWIQT